MPCTFARFTPNTHSELNFCLLGYPMTLLMFKVIAINRIVKSGLLAYWVDLSLRPSRHDYVTEFVKNFTIFLMNAVLLRVKFWYKSGDPQQSIKQDMYPHRTMSFLEQGYTYTVMLF
jgi:hypothetical protein